MKTIIVPIRNMCGYPQGKARVTINSIGNYFIEPLSGEEYKGRLNFNKHNNYVHHGIIFPGKGNKTYG